MRLLTIVICLFITSLPGQCYAQLSLYSNSELDGIVVRRSQTVVAPAIKLRFFKSIETKGKDPLTAIANLKTEKKSFLSVANEAGATKGSVKFASTKIKEWAPEKSAAVFSNHVVNPITVKNLQVSEPSDEDFTATTRASFDVSLEGVDPNDFPARLHKVLQLLPREDKFDFDATRFSVVYVGEIDAAQIVDARKTAFDKAKAEATALAALADQPLGKLVAIETDGDRFGYNQGSNFARTDNEVVSHDPQKLSLDCTVTLRFEIK